MLVKDLFDIYMNHQPIKLYVWVKEITKKGKDKSGYRLHDDFNICILKHLLPMTEIHEKKCKICLYTTGMNIVGETRLEVYILKNQEEDIYE